MVGRPIGTVRLRRGLPDRKGNTKPTAFHFTASNQQFLGAVEETRGKITKDWVAESLDDCNGKMKPGMNLRWDPDAERGRALMGVQPKRRRYYRKCAVGMARVPQFASIS